MTAGSRGDVAPYTGLGHGLSRAGHEVTLVTHARFEPLVTGSGVRFHPLPVDPLAELESSRGRGLHRSTTGVGKLVRVVALARALAGQMTDDLVAAGRSSDLLLLSGSVGPLGHTIAEGCRCRTWTFRSNRLPPQGSSGRRCWEFALWAPWATGSPGTG